MGNGGIIGAKNTGTSGIWTMEDVLLDVNGIRTTQTPQVGSYEKTGIIGVQDTGTRSTNGAGLVQVAYGSNAIAQTTLDTAYFDKHPAYQFPEYIYGGNYFRRIPITYWWRGNLPSVSNGTTPRWTMRKRPVSSSCRSSPTAPASPIPRTSISTPGKLMFKRSSNVTSPASLSGRSGTNKTSPASGKSLIRPPTSPS